MTDTIDRKHRWLPKRTPAIASTAMLTALPEPDGAALPLSDTMRFAYVRGMRDRINLLPELRAASEGSMAAKARLATAEARAVMRTQTFANAFPYLELTGADFLGDRETRGLEEFAQLCGQWDTYSPHVTAAAGLLDRRLLHLAAAAQNIDTEGKRFPTLQSIRASVSARDVDAAQWSEAGRLLLLNRFTQLSEYSAALNSESRNRSFGRSGPAHSAAARPVDDLVFE